MTDFESAVRGRTKVLEALGWSGAALVTIGAHAAAIGWLLRSDAVAAADSSPPAAIMVDIAAVPEATRTDQNEITPDSASMDDSRPQQDEKQQTPRETAVEQRSEPDKPEPPEDPKTDEMNPVVEKAEVPLPPRPPRPETKPTQSRTPEKKPQQRRQQAAAASRAMRQVQIQANLSTRIAAAQTTSGGASMSPADWRSLLMAHLKRRKRAVSATAGTRAVAYVRFSIDGGGHVLSAALLRSSGVAEVDREAVALVQRASPVPSPPPSAARTLTVPVGFTSAE
ncbi:TonB family protein [Rhodopseudomonas palustris]|uniref:energy transducer TonB family protein n=1 Tax=Rhodopseudomonas palustris TaxID=1076 RepID=UPI0020CBEE56|nr:TonB family protein [Rhodopseudomonas palustris]MCP9630523.1 TonB family protein [Rhodopseudomonas palustris]